MTRTDVLPRPAAGVPHLVGSDRVLAVLEGTEIVYRSKVDPPAGAVRLTSTVGGRNPAHSTAVGELLLAHALPDDAALPRDSRA